MNERVSFGPLAERRIRELDISRADLESARVGPGAETEGREFLRKYGSLPDGRRVVMESPFDRPQHVQKFRVLSDDE